MEDEIEAGIAAAIDGVSARDVSVTGYTELTRRLRGLAATGAGSLLVAFEVAAPAGEAAAVREAFVAAATDEPAMLQSIQGAVASRGGDFSAVQISAIGAIEMPRVAATAIEAPTPAPGPAESLLGLDAKIAGLAFGLAFIGVAALAWSCCRRESKMDRSHPNRGHRLPRGDADMLSWPEVPVDRGTVA